MFSRIDQLRPFFCRQVLSQPADGRVVAKDQNPFSDKPLVAKRIKIGKSAVPEIGF